MLFILQGAVCCCDQKVTHWFIFLFATLRFYALYLQVDRGAVVEFAIEVTEWQAEGYVEEDTNCKKTSEVQGQQDTQWSWETETVCQGLQVEVIIP